MKSDYNLKANVDIALYFMFSEKTFICDNDS